MAHKLSITVDDDVFSYLESKSGQNRSGFINELIRERQNRDFDVELAQQLRDDAADPDVKAEADLWERITLLDGLEDWEDDWDDTKAPRNMVG